MEYGIIKCVETGFEYGYSDPQTREFIIADLVAHGYSWNDRLVTIS